MSSQIVPLKCPSCGNSNNVIANELRFGYEFRCQFCSTVSILVINEQLYIPRPGERVCVKCGRVSSSESRYCQCGASLIRICINSSCKREILVSHEICEYCGSPQITQPSKFIIHRRTNFTGSFEKIYISADNKRIGELWNDETITFDLFMGDHTISAAGGFWTARTSIKAIPDKIYRFEVCYLYFRIELNPVIT